MIGRLTGRLLECSPGEILLDVAGVGYAVQIPLSTFYALSANGRDGAASVSLHVHTHVREDVLQLFGFSEPLERLVFEQLIGISGVGPRLALAILSGIGAAELEQAVERQDRERLQRIPGVGRKTAERLLLELRDRLAKLQDRAGGGVTPASPAPPGGRGRRDDAVSALANLGYKTETGGRAVDAALEQLGPDAPLEDLLKVALSGIVG